MMSGENSQVIETLWNEWFHQKDEHAANELVKHYMYLVDFHVERIASHIPANFDREELKSLGLMGLFDALNKFELDRELKFETYASFRVRGSIMDGLRKEDWLPRRLRELSKKIDKITRQLEQQLQRTPTATEIGEQLDLPAEEVETIMSNTMFANIISLDGQRRRSSNEEEQTFAATIVDHEATLPDEHILTKELQTVLANKIKQLNENEQLVISLFYHDELTLTEIGRVLDLTTSRISQIHKQAIYKLKDALKKVSRS